MKERPILFSGPMVDAIFDGRKTQTRRVIKFPKWMAVNDYQDAILAMNKSETMRIGLRGPCDGFSHIWACLYGRSGDHLWVRESWRPLDDTPTPKLMAGDTIYYRADYVGEALEGKWRPSIHMPRWASRLTLEIVKLRVERVGSIGGTDAFAEGGFTVSQFIDLWDSLNAKRGYSWESNPWVWVIEFAPLSAGHPPILKSKMGGARGAF